jgi:hypothetical protein
MDPPVFASNGKTATYQPKLNFHPLYPSNERNIVMGPANPQNPTVVGISAEMRDLRPDSPYGVRTGYTKRVRTPLAVNPIGTGWHTFRWEVLSHYEYQLYWDGVLVADVVEKLPSTIDPGPVPIGLRLDFLDVEFKNQRVDEHMPVPKIVVGQSSDIFIVPQTRILDTRQGAQIKARVNTQLPITGVPPAGATSMILNAIAVNPEADGYFTLYSAVKPQTSSINYRKGSATSNFVIVPVNSNRELRVYSSASTDIVLDLVGYMI